MAGDWNFLVGRLTGDGSIDIIESDLPINLSSVTTNLSAPASLSGSIPFEVTRLKALGRPIFDPGDSVILAEASGVLKAIAIYEAPTFQGNVWNWESAGLASYLNGMPYDGEIEFTKQDPLNIYRHIWEHAQSKPNGNLGVTIDSLTTPIRVGGPPPVGPVETIGDAAQAILDRFNSGLGIFEDWSWVGMPAVADRYNDALLIQYRDGLGGRDLNDIPAVKAWLAKFVADRQAEVAALPSTPEPEVEQEEPRRLNWWSTPNLGDVVDELSRETPFDWAEDVFWNGNEAQCNIRLGYPILGDRRDVYRIVLGENLATNPSASQPTYANEVIVLGNGEGRAKVRGYASVADGRLRRVKHILDESIMAKTAADARARLEIASSRGEFSVDTLTVYNHPNLPIDAIELGMEVPLYAEMDHVTIDNFVRVVGKTESPEQSDQAVLTVVHVGVT